jgi:hypothetical protein
MPQASTITLADAAGTPVNHNFVPNGKDAKGIYWFVDRSQSNAVGYWKISVEQVSPPEPKAGISSRDRNFRIRIGLHEPVLEVLSNSTVSGILPAPTVAYIPRCFTEYVLPERMAVLERQHLRKMSANLLANAQIVAVVENLDFFFG